MKDNLMIESAAEISLHNDIILKIDTLEKLMFIM
jgi:hypothetical protein